MVIRKEDIIYAANEHFNDWERLDELVLCTIGGISEFRYPWRNKATGEIEFRSLQIINIDEKGRRK